MHYITATTLISVTGANHERLGRDEGTRHPEPLARSRVEGRCTLTPRELATLVTDQQRGAKPRWRDVLRAPTEQEAKREQRVADPVPSSTTSPAELKSDAAPSSV
eukprot:CAMPEP_0119434694 /NCGR_PEP_ID=MMETSP1335-20130426/50797_1 /TAXON_ID=259385 /ORGANISM="Chrysoculter rhomboideus, Strain RCC1486" /LENGTH=104 /DNA_ID=CAMNT_0007460549 /DNA_START=807 /DNA_END=1122 /DNA_ORIENTATION=+